MGHTGISFFLLAFLDTSVHGIAKGGSVHIVACGQTKQVSGGTCQHQCAGTHGRRLAALGQRYADALLVQSGTAYIRKRNPHSAVGVSGAGIGIHFRNGNLTCTDQQRVAGEEQMRADKTVGDNVSAFCAAEIPRVAIGNPAVGKQAGRLTQNRMVIILRTGNGAVKIAQEGFPLLFHIGIAGVPDRSVEEKE